MGEAQTPGVQHVPLKFSRMPSVQFISNDRVTQVLQMHTNLMGSTGQQLA
jgi:hypothetical protein